MITELKQVISQRAALGLAGVARSTWHYLHAPRPRTTDPVPHTARRSQAWLRPGEVEQITARLTDPRFAQDAVAQVFFKTWDEGVYIASLRTWHRVAARLPPRRAPRRRASRPASAIPQLHASAPGQVWCWDITKLPTSIRGSSYEFYVAMDIYSRMVVAHRVEKVEDDELARDMFTTAVAIHGVPGTLHSDGGPSMTSNTMKEFMTSMGITASRNRPRVSNDNAYCESGFKTAKYRPTYPGTFTSHEHATTWANQYVSWYNHHHRHSGIGWHTPASVHDGTYQQITTARQAVLDAAANPARHHRPPKAPALPIEAWINKPDGTNK